MAGPDGTISQRLSVPLPVGSIITVYEDGDIVYEAAVEQHVPKTGLILMSDGTKRIGLLNIIESGDSVAIDWP